MTDTSAQLLETMSHAFFQDRFDLIAQHFTYPLPFYANGGLTVIGGRAIMVEVLSLYRAATRKANITRIVPRLVACGMPVRGYSNIWVECDHLDDTGTCLRTNQVHYAVFQDAAAPFPKIEMIDYTVTAFPEVQDDFPALATV